MSAWSWVTTSSRCQIALPGHTRTGDRLSRVGQAARARCREHLRAGHGYGAGLRRMLEALQVEQAKYRNQPGWYWIAEADPDAAEHALLGPGATTARASQP